MRELKLGLDDFKLSKQINVLITDPIGKESTLTFSLHDTVRLLKEKALGEKFGKDASTYKLMLIRTRKTLEDSRTLEQEEVQDNDEFMLWKRRIEGANTSSFQRVPLSSKGPDLSTVKRLTLPLGTEMGGSSSTGAGVPMLFDFFAGLKKILTSLTEVASLLQFVKGEDKEDMEIDVEDTSVPEVDKGALKQLLDMGFSEERSKKALFINKMNPAQAMEWLLQHEDDSSIDTPLTPEEIQLLYPSSFAAKVPRKNGKREFVPNPKALHDLKDMGFDEGEAIKALKINGNHQESALDWLLGDRQETDENAEQGLDPESPIYHAIMNHPVVQLGMTNPRILHAFEDMLENPHSIAQYINDPEIGPVLLQISRIVQTFSR